MDTVLPGDSAALPVNAPGLPSGATSPCTVTLGYGDGKVATWSGTVSVNDTSRRPALPTGPGAFSTLPPKSFPTWAIILIVLGSLVLGALAAVVILLLRRRPHIPAPEHGPPA